MLHFLRVFLTLFTLMFSLSNARANLQHKVVFEGELSERVSNVLSRFDPYHRVSVEVQFKSLSAPLPGTDLVMSNFSTIQTEIRSSDIKSIVAKVNTSKSPLPTWLSEEIRSILKFPGVPVDLEFAPLPEEQLLVMQKEMLSNQYVKNSITKFQEQMNYFYWLILAGLIAGLVVSFLFFKVRSSQFKNTLQNEMSRLIAGLSEVSMGDSRGLNGNELQNAQSSLRRNDEGTQNGAFDDASVASVAHLLSDCYWCEMDNYAAWVWKKVPFQIKTQLFEQADFFKEYTAILSKLEPEFAQFHEHSQYLSEGHLLNISQGDLKVFLKKHPALWHQLSKMRQDNLGLKLSERVRLLQSEEKLSLAVWDKISKSSSARRQLNLGQSVPISNIEDELEVFHSPDSIPPEIFNSLESLVPLALAPLELRRELLSKFSSLELASAWCGPDEVLANLAEALPEKKRKILDSYVERQAPTRGSIVFLKLVQEFRALHQAQNSEQKKAA